MKPGQEVKSLDVKVSTHEGHCGQPMEGLGVGGSRAGWGDSSHSPLLFFLTERKREHAQMEEGQRQREGEHLR